MNIKNAFKNNSIFRSIIIGLMIGVCLSGIVMPQATSADFANTANAAYVAKITNKAKGVIKTIKVVVTAYASVPEETDSTPFITASGKYVADGIIANNMLPFGTRIMIPQLYGNKIFTVEDRLASYKSKYHIDIWMASKPLAVKFGVKTADIEILEN